MDAQGKRWLIVIASTLALIVGQGSINVFAAGVFLKPMAAELGFGRGEISTAIGVSNVMIAIATPFFGRMLDVHGVRRPLLLSIFFYALATAAIALAPASAIGIYTLFALTGLVGVGQNPGAYSKVISAWFDRQRGLALGIALAGVGVGTAVIPIISDILIRNFGWRVGYVGLGAVILILAFIPVLLFVREPVRADQGLPTPSVAAPGDLPGVTLAQARSEKRFWAILAAFFFATVAINGTLVHVVPMLTDRGIPLPQAIAVISSAGMALIVGRLFAGWLIDRLFAPYVAIFFLLCPMAGLLVLALEPVGVTPMVGAVLLGAGIGAEVDLLSYLVSRYFGIRNFGAIYGLMFTSVVLGNAVGATVMGWTYQISGAYFPALIGYCVLLAAASVLMAFLGPYRYPPRDETLSEKTADSARAS